MMTTYPMNYSWACYDEIPKVLFSINNSTTMIGLLAIHLFAQNLGCKFINPHSNGPTQERPFLIHSSAGSTVPTPWHRHKLSGFSFSRFLAASLHSSCFPAFTVCYHSAAMAPDPVKSIPCNRLIAFNTLPYIMAGSNQNIKSMIIAVRVGVWK